MTIGVATPKGRVGSYVLRLLVQAGERPGALLRDPATLDPEVAEHVEVATLDAWDKATVVEATKGLRAVYWVSPTATDRDSLAAHAAAARHLRRCARHRHGHRPAAALGRSRGPGCPRCRSRRS